MQSVLRLLAAVAEQKHIPILLVGGYALQAYGVARQTLDLDILVSETHADFVDAALKGGGYAEVARSDIFVRYRHSSILLADVDVLFVDADTAKRMGEKATHYASGETVHLVPALPHLIAMKLHAMRNNPQREPRDFADIIELARANPERLDRDELRSLCGRYGPEGVWGKFEAALWKTR